MGFTVAEFGAVPTSERSDAGFQQRLKAPLNIRGFGPVKQAAVKDWRAEGNFRSH